MSDLITLRPQGLYCEAGQFYIDPWRPVDRAIITHCHADHARWGMGQYIGAARATGLVKVRLGKVNFFGLPFGETLNINGVKVSLHPAGHILGSAQVRVEFRGQIWVASGDYKVEPDRTCDAFESVKCHTFITESTFGLPIYHWTPEQQIFESINQWWQDNASNGKASVLYGYSLGKAQRILAGVNRNIGPILCHSAVEPLSQVYREAGIDLPETFGVMQINDKRELAKCLVLAPPSVAGSAWMKRFGVFSDAFASGWMQLRGARRRRAMDRGFVLSDHADWLGLQSAIGASQAEQVIVTHGYVPVMVRWLNQRGLQARAFQTEYGTSAESDDLVVETPS
jgi:putative mRNA 3-end processing factor